jgi:flagellar biogenesis protein FliO
MSWSQKKSGSSSNEAAGSLAVWLLEKLRPSRRESPRLAVVERITLAPRQSLALVEAEGRRLLVATSPEGAPAFYDLDANKPPAQLMRRPNPGNSGRRVSW